MSDHILHNLVYKLGQQNGSEDTIIIPLLQQLNIPHAISFGPAARNMAERFEKSLDTLYEREELFLAKNGLASLENAIISRVPEHDTSHILTVTKKDNLHLKSGTKIQAECLFTTTPGLLLMHKPADCPTAIIKATDKNGQTVLGLAHLGRPQVNRKVSEQVLEYVLNNLGSKPEDVFIGISPSISPKHYWIKTADQEEKNLIDRDYWGLFAVDDLLDEEKIIRIDVLGKILSLMAASKIPKENIEAYGHDDNVDTYALAANNPPKSFSHRFATSTKQPDRNGRFVVAAQLS